MPSTWFQWHADLITAGMRVLDLACGSGGNAIAAAELGAKVVAVDRDPAQLKAAEEAAGKANVAVQFVAADLTSDPIPDGPYDVVMAFSYLDRERMPRFLDAVKPGGYFILETFLEQQRELGWGPTSDDHLLKAGELWQLVEPFEILLAREVLEVLDGRSSAVASVLAQRPPV
jgi:cyclopropane fatty-acyl-phospholipid synthase-like methyltransferase